MPMKNLQLLIYALFFGWIALALSCSKDPIETPVPPILEETEEEVEEVQKGNIKIIEDNFNGVSLIVVGDSMKRFMVAFEAKTVGGTALTFEAVQDELPVVMVDNEGNKWDVFGEAIEENRKGERLQSLDAYMGYWFSWGTFYANVEIHQGTEGNAPPNEAGTGEWSVPTTLVLNGGPGKDGIPALENPETVNPEEVDYVGEEDLVVGFKSGNTIRAYPHSILDWHEIINDELEETEIAITYCPLTGTSIGWDRNVDGNLTTFGVSGRLYNTNLIPYDRATDSNWSQMRLDCINGALKGTKIKTHLLVETTWATWKQMYPQTEVVSTNTGHVRLYGTYPYTNRDGDDYRYDNDFLIFPITYEDTRLPQKERVLGVIVEGKAKVYRFAAFE